MSYYDPKDLADDIADERLYEVTWLECGSQEEMYESEARETFGEDWQDIRHGRHPLIDALPLDAAPSESWSMTHSGHVSGADYAHGTLTEDDDVSDDDDDVSDDDDGNDEPTDAMDASGYDTDREYTNDENADAKATGEPKMEEGDEDGFDSEGGDNVATLDTDSNVQSGSEYDGQDFGVGGEVAAGMEDGNDLDGNDLDGNDLDGNDLDGNDLDGNDLDGNDLDDDVMDVSEISPQERLDGAYDDVRILLDDPQLLWPHGSDEVIRGLLDTLMDGGLITIPERQTEGFTQEPGLGGASPFPGGHQQMDGDLGVDGEWRADDEGDLGPTEFDDGGYEGDFGGEADEDHESAELIADVAPKTSNVADEGRQAPRA